MPRPICPYGCDAELIRSTAADGLDYLNCPKHGSVLRDGRRDEEIPGAPPEPTHSPGNWPAVRMPPPRDPGAARPRIVGFVKAYNEMVKGNLPRCLANLRLFCDAVVACDDGSEDDSAYWLRKWCGEPNVIAYRDNDFAAELERKQALLDLALSMDPEWIFWLDADEVLGREGVESVRAFCASRESGRALAYRFPEVQLWLCTTWARTDAGFADGAFIRLWRAAPGLAFDVRPGTHHHQFPRGIIGNEESLPWPVIHYGNASLKHIQWKVDQYYTGLGGWRRHLENDGGIYAQVPEAAFPEGAERAPSPPPGPIPAATRAAIERSADRSARAGRFLICMPTNRADFMDAAVSSVLAQTYPNWELWVLDDGSAGEAVRRLAEPLAQDPANPTSPKVFYVRYDWNRGACVHTSTSFGLAIRRAEYWTWLGSDDLWAPTKLANDRAHLLSRPGDGAVYAPYQVLRPEGGGWATQEVSNEELTPETVASRFESGQYVASYANIAVRSSALRAVRDVFGGFMDPSIWQMNDFHAEFRISRVARFGWRPQCDAFWRDNPQGASQARARQGEADRRATLAAIRDDLESLRRGDRGGR